MYLQSVDKKPHFDVVKSNNIFCNFWADVRIIDIVAIQYSVKNITSPWKCVHV